MSESENIEAQGLPVTIHAQYVKDLSFENPHAPESMRAGQKQPEIQIQINMDARDIQSDKLNNLYEVTLSVRAEAARDDNPVFIAEVFYGITVQVGEQVDKDKHHPLLLIEIPKYAFPYVRKIVSDLAIDGGYPPLLLTPVDFHALYMKKFASEGKETDAA